MACSTGPEKVCCGSVWGLQRLDGSLSGFHNAGALQSGDLNDRAAQLAGEFLDVDLVAVLLDDVHHVDGHDHRDAELGQLRGEVEVPLRLVPSTMFKIASGRSVIR